MAEFYESRYGNQRLWCSSIRTDKGRTIVIHEPTAGDNYVIQDRGRKVHRAECELMFDDFDGAVGSPAERWRAFEAVANDGKSHIFAHPIDGSYLARIEGLDHSIDEFGVITASVTFIAVSSVDSVVPAGASSIPATGANAVSSAAAAHTSALAAIGATSVHAATADAAAASWAESDTVTPRDVLGTTSTLTADLGDEAATYENDLNQWEAQRATLLLADAVRLAADAATAESSATFALRLSASQSLRALVASVYGADEAESRLDEVMRLNDLDNPAMLPGGIELILPALAPQSRRY